MKIASNGILKPWIEVVVIWTSAALAYFLIFGAQFVLDSWVPGGDTQNLWSAYYLAIYSLRHFGEFMWWDPTALNGWPAYYLMYFGWANLLSPFQLAQQAIGAIAGVFADLSINRYLVLQKTIFVVAINILGITLISRELLANTLARFFPPLVYALCGMQFLGFVAGPTSDALPAAIFLIYGLIHFNTRRSPGSLLLLILFAGIYASSINYMTLQSHVYALGFFTVLVVAMFPGFVSALWANTKLLAKSRLGVACLVIGLLVLINGLIVFWVGVKGNLPNFARLFSGSVPYDINSANQFAPPYYAITWTEIWTNLFYWIPYSDFHAFTMNFDPYPSGHEYRYIGLATLPLIVIALVSGLRNRYTLCFSLAFFLCVSFVTATVQNLPFSFLIERSAIFRNIRSMSVVMPRDLVCLFPIFAAAIGLDTVMTRRFLIAAGPGARRLAEGALLVLGLIAVVCLFQMATVPALAPVRGSLGHIGVYLFIFAGILLVMLRARDEDITRTLGWVFLVVGLVDLTIAASDQWKNNNVGGRYYHYKSAIYMRAEDAGIGPISSEAQSWPGNYYQGTVHNVHLGGPHFGLRYWLALVTRPAWQPVLDGWNPVTRMVTKYPHFKFFTNGAFVPESAIYAIDSVPPPATEMPGRILQDAQGEYIRYDGRRYPIVPNSRAGVVERAEKSVVWPDRHVFSGSAADPSGKPAGLVLVFLGDALWYVGSPNQRGMPSPPGDKEIANSRFVLEVPVLPEQAVDGSGSVRLFTVTADEHALELEYAAGYPFATVPQKKYAKGSNSAVPSPVGVTFYLHEPSLVKPNVPGRRLYDAKWEVLDFTLNRVKVKVDLPEPGFMVYLDNYDRYWSAYVNGSAAPIHRANFTFKSVYLPAGDSVVEWVYNPYWLKIAWATYYVLLILFIGLLFGFARSPARW